MRGGPEHGRRLPRARLLGSGICPWLAAWGLVEEGRDGASSGLARAERVDLRLQLLGVGIRGSRSEELREGQGPEAVSDVNVSHLVD